MSSFLVIKKVFDLSASNDAQMLVSRQSRELSATSNDIVTTMKKHFDYTVDVSFDSAGGTACVSSTYVLGQHYKDLPTTTRSSYIFQGWFTQLTGGIQISAGSTVELSTTNLYAQWKYADIGTDYTEYVVQTKSSYKKTGIYSATRYSSTSPVVVDWGDGNVEAVDGNINQLAHEYSSVGVFHVKISNISNFAASNSNATWYTTTSQNRYTFKDIVKTGSHCTSIPSYAFYYCSALSSISFLSSCFTNLKTVPSNAFYRCSSITTNLSSLPLRIKTLGNSAFRYCTGLKGIQDLRNTGLTSFTSNYIFANCTGVKEFKLPSSIGASAGDDLFYQDTGLSAIQIPPSLTAVPYSMAYDCTGLRNIVIPSNVKSIGSYSFRGCTNLSSVTYETTALTSIGTYAFYQNYALQDLNVPNTVKSIGNYAFYYCYNTHASALTLPSALTSLGTYAYQYCNNLKTLEIPSALTSIGNTAFSGCRALSSITDHRLTAQIAGANTFGSAIGTGTTSYTGYNTHGSNKLRIYSAATGYDTSYWLDPLQNADKCGFSIEYIDQQLTCTVTLNAGEGSVSPTSVDYVYGATMSTLPTPTPPSGKTFIGWNTSSDGTGTTYTTSSTAPSQAMLVLYAIYSGDQPTYHADTWYKYASDTEWRTVSITGDISGDSSSHTPTTQIPNVTNVVALEIGSDVTSIGAWAFYSCSDLMSVTIPDSVTSIGYYAFRQCDLTSVTIPDSVTSVEQGAFWSCGNLTSVMIGSNIMSIGSNVFSYCYNLRQITINKLITEIQAMNPSLWFWYNMDPSFDVIITGTDGSFIITVSCFLKGTDILLADNTTKKIEDLTYDDILKVWDFDEGQLGSAKVCWLTKPGLTNDHYYQLTFDNGTVLKTTGINSNHRIFSVDQSKFTNVADAKVGDKVFSIDGTLTITDVKYIEEECEYYNVMTSGKINCFANGILTSDRYGNLYPIQNMKYVKDDREIKPYSLYESVGIDRYWYDNLRLGENTETVEKSKEYVWKCIGQMLPLPDNN